MGNPIHGLARLGQCVWLDTLSRQLINSGRLRELSGSGVVSGVTTNPSIFQKAISGSSDYDDSMRRLIREGCTGDKDLFFQLAIEDVGAAADTFRRSYEKSKGRHGFASIEVAPDLAYDTNATIAEARWLFSALGRKNIMIKVPATREGLPAIEQLTADGVNVNATLLFSVRRYEEVAGAFMAGLERRMRNNHAIDEIASVASFFVSRVDTLVDSRLEGLAADAGPGAAADTYARLSGRAAVANARLAYQSGKGIRQSERFRRLEARGARFQRLLWGSTGTKNPSYSDIKYVQELIGPDTINTMPMETIRAYMERGEPEVTIEDDLEGAGKLFDELRAAGIDMEEVARELETDGVRKFADSYFELLSEIGRKKERFLF